VLGVCGLVSCREHTQIDGYYENKEGTQSLGINGSRVDLVIGETIGGVATVRGNAAVEMSGELLALSVSRSSNYPVAWAKYRWYWRGTHILRRDWSTGQEEVFVRKAAASVHESSNLRL
jgi:hypothetical protein